MIFTATRKKSSRVLDTEAVGQAVLDHIERVTPKLRGATKASEIHGPATSPSDGMSARRESGEDALARRVHRTNPEQPSWNKRGLFKAGYNIGPRLRGAKLFTKGKER